jgi:predicted DsbA family dithiol-disulfide isomerase
MIDVAGAGAMHDDKVPAAEAHGRSLTPSRAEVTVEVVSDPVCPWCFVGKRRLDRAIAARPRLRIEVIWRPFLLNPGLPLGGMPRRAYLEAKFGDAARADEMYARISELGRGEGIAFAFERIARTPNSLRAHRLLHRARSLGRQHEVAEALFRAFFEDGEDLGDVRVLSAIAAAAGMDPATTEQYLASDEDSQAVLAMDAAARRVGIDGVPCFVVCHRHIIAGAQPTKVLLRLIDLSR